MRFINRLLKHQNGHPSGENEVPKAPCAHVTLIPHWGCTGDMGKQERVEWYRCESCGSTFPRDEGAQLAADQAGRARLANIERAHHR